MIKMKEKEMKMKRRKFALVLLVILVLLGSIVLTKEYFTSYYEAASRSKNIKKANEDNPRFSVDGWVRVQGTKIDYPVIYNGPDTIIEDYNGDYIWINNDATELTNVVSIFGHNIMNLSSKPLIADPSHVRFEQLPSFLYYDFVYDNKYIQYTVGNKDYLYKIYGVSLVSNDKLLFYTENEDENILKDYIKEVKKASFFDFDIDVNENDKLIILTTCTRFFESNKYSLRIDGRLVRENERISNYGVKEKKNYEKIKKIMKGDNEIEE